MLLKKLRLDSANPVADAESIVAMAIHWIMQTAWTVSKETGDIYSTNEPQIAFDFRITFCLNMQNEAGQAFAVSALYAQGKGECREEEREAATGARNLQSILQRRTMTIFRKGALLFYCIPGIHIFVTASSSESTQLFFISLYVFISDKCTS